MSGLAAVVVSAAPTNEKIHVYYSTTKLNLGVQLENGESDGDDPNKVFVAKSSDQAGLIPNPSQLAATVLFGMNLVVGITKPATGTKNDVSIVSPIYRPLDSTEAANKSVGVCSTGKKAWVYYLKGADADSVKLQEYYLGDFSTLKKADNDEILQTSGLAAYHDSVNDKRNVIYQGKAGKDLYEYCVEDDSTTHIQGSKDAASSTPITAVYSKDKKTVYLYYINGSDKIERIKKTSSGWGSSTVIDKKADTAYQMSVVWSDSIPHLFYVTPGSTTMTHYRDTNAS